MSTLQHPSQSRPITITEHQLRDILSGVRGAQPVSFIALTTPEQKVNPLLNGAKVRKLVRVNAMTGCRYANAAAKHGVSASEERAWGERNESALVTRPAKNGSGEVAYLPVQLNHVSRPLYLVPNVSSGRLQAVPASVVAPYLRPERAAPVAYKDYALRNIISLALGGRRYRVRHPIAHE